MSSEHLSASSAPDDLSNPVSTSIPRRSPGITDAPAVRRGRVRFNNETNDPANQKPGVPTRQRDLSLPPVPSIASSLANARADQSHSRSSSLTSLLRPTPESEEENPFEDTFSDPEPHPVSRRPTALENGFDQLTAPGEVRGRSQKDFSALAAQQRAKHIAAMVGSHSAPLSARASLDDELHAKRAQLRPANTRRFSMTRDIPLMNLDLSKTYDGAGPDYIELDMTKSRNLEARNLVRAHTRKFRSGVLSLPDDSAVPIASGYTTPTEEQSAEDYIPSPQRFRPSVLANLLKLYKPSPSSRPGTTRSLEGLQHGSSESQGSSGMTTPISQQQKWYHRRNQSQDTLTNLVEASSILAGPTGSGMGTETHSGGIIGVAANKLFKRPLEEDHVRVTAHIAEALSRQRYLEKVCKALMSYGAPTHRLEEYMQMSARVLEINGQFLYFPGCMIISFDDDSTHTTEVKIVKSAQGVDLGKLKDVHQVYKEVVHDVIGAEEAIKKLKSIEKAEPNYSPWVLVLVYGFASATVAPYAFEGRLVDIPIAWLLGCILGFLQLIVAPRSTLYSNVFEISATVLTSFLARAFGSIRGGNLFCFSALSQSAIALILPGYMILCGSLELQSRSLVAGSVRIVYAIIYSLFLGYGITIGTALYGLINSNATSSTHCQNTMSPYYRFIFVPLFTLCLTVINKAKWKQTPVMVLVAFSGYVVNFFSARRFPSAPQISSTLGALAVGVLANLYSRMHRGLAAAALIPAIFVQVPSGLAASGSLLAGLNTADQLTNTSLYPNGTARINGTSIVTVGSGQNLNSIVFNVGFSMIQVVIGTTVGLFLSALIIYPLGKKRSGLFSF